MCTPTLYSTHIIVITWDPSWEWGAASGVVVRILMIWEPTKGWSGEFIRSCWMTGNAQPFAIEEHRDLVLQLVIQRNCTLGLGRCTKKRVLWSLTLLCGCNCLSDSFLCSSGWLGTHDLPTCSLEGWNWKHVPFLVASLIAIQSTSVVWTSNPSSSNINKLCLEQDPTTHPGKRIKTGWSLF